MAANKTSFVSIGAADRHQQIADRWDRCAGDFWYFAMNYLWITDKRSKDVLLKPNHEQVELILAIEKHGTVYNLKARKLGMSTIVCAYFFWKCHFYKGFQAGTMTHDEESAKKLFKKVKKYYKELPEAFKVGQFKLKEDRASGMEWEHGSEYRVASCDSGRFRSSDLAAIHFSEFAFYGTPQETIESCIGAALPNAIKVYETTAKGLGHAHDTWYRDQGWGKVFFPWMRDPLARRTSRPDRWNPKSEDHERLLTYASEQNLTVPQMWWAAQQLGEYNNSWKSFHQEHPATPELAFAMATGRVFRVAFKHAKPYIGLSVFKKPIQGHSYVIGVDPAGGSETGDFSAFCVIDISIEHEPEIVASYYKRESAPHFKQEVAEAAELYNNALVVVERNSIGMPLLQFLQEDHPEINLWREQKYDKVGSKLTTRLGFYTGANSRGTLVAAMLKWLGDQEHDPVINIPCERMQHEMNTFVWSEARNDHAEHQPGYHDDMLFAFALACQAMSSGGRFQTAPAEEKDPKTLRDLMMFEKKTGRPWIRSIDGNPNEADGDERAYYMHQFSKQNVPRPLKSSSQMLQEMLREP